MEHLEGLIVEISARMEGLRRVPRERIAEELENIINIIREFKEENDGHGAK